MILKYFLSPCIQQLRKAPANEDSLIRPFNSKPFLVICQDLDFFNYGIVSCNIFDGESTVDVYMSEELCKEKQVNNISLINGSIIIINEYRLVNLEKSGEINENKSIWIESFSNIGIFWPTAEQYDQIDFKEYSCFNFSDLICNIPANLLKLKYKTNSINENRKTVLENIDRSIGLDTILKLNANSKFSLLCILLNSGVLEEFKTPQLYKRKILLIDQCNKYIELNICSPLAKNFSFINGTMLLIKNLTFDSKKYIVFDKLSIIEEIEPVDVSHFKVQLLIEWWNQHGTTDLKKVSPLHPIEKSRSKNEIKIKKRLHRDL